MASLFDLDIDDCLNINCLMVRSKSANQTFKIPIAVQDMSHTQSSKQLIHQINQSKYVDVRQLSEDDFYIDDLVKKRKSWQAYKFLKTLIVNLKTTI